MRSEADVRRVFELWDEGHSKKAIARKTGVSRTQVRVWIARGIDGVLASSPRRGHAEQCGAGCEPWLNLDARSYAYLFGQYLGDGYISQPPRGAPRLRITTCDAYPAIRRECEDAIRQVMPYANVGHAKRQGCTEVCCSSPHWPCLFPQHGPGRKHDRPLILEPWQEQIVFELHPDLFLRGLVHSDGCRSMNWTTHPKTGKRYTYPRYLFMNKSLHIQGFFREACGRLGVECRKSNPNTLSVAKRSSVEKLDAFIGPKS